MNFIDSRFVGQKPFFPFPIPVDVDVDATNRGSGAASHFRSQFPSFGGAVVVMPRISVDGVADFERRRSGGAFSSFRRPCPPIDGDVADDAQLDGAEMRIAEDAANADDELTVVSTISRLRLFPVGDPRFDPTMTIVIVISRY